MKNHKLFFVMAVLFIIFSIITPGFAKNNSEAVDQLTYLPIIIGPQDGGGPNPEKIAFVGGSTFDLFTINPDGTEQDQLTTLNADLDSLSWSPNGKNLLFARELADKNIYTINADGSNLDQLTTDPAADSGPYWSPDGSQIVFASGRTGNGEIYKMNADGSNVIKLTSRNKDDYQPHWSPDGNTIVFTEFYSGTLTIYKMDTNGGNLDTVTNGPYNESVVAWSPDSTSLLVYSKRHSPAISDLIVIDLNGNEIFNLSPNGDPGGAAFSPDGTKILFSVDGGSWQQTYIANADGTDINVLQCNGHPMFSWEYSWASTGDRFATTAYSSQAIVIRNLTTGTCEYITGGIYSIYLAWRP